MAVLTVPGGSYPKLINGRMGLRSGNNILEAFDGSQQVTVYTKYAWAMEFDLPPDNSTLFWEWRAVLAQLCDPSNTIRIVPPELPDGGPTSGYSGANPLVEGGSQVGSTLSCDGVPNSTLIVKKGDFMHVDTAAGRELKIITADATSDGTGDVDLPIFPPLKAAPANNATVELQDPVGEWRLEEPNADWFVNKNLVGGASIQLIEAIT